jgi:membrane protein DedA with SNARE-associated domain
VHTLFLHYLEVFRTAAYAVIFLGLVLEGELVLFTALVLAHQGYLRIGELIPVVIVGVLLGDYLWYRVGRYMGDTPSRFSHLAAKASKIFSRSITDNPLRVLLVSKFTYGLHRLTLVSVGIHKLPPKIFFRNDALAVCVWLAVVGSAAWAASASLSLFKHYLKYAEASIFAAVFIVYLLEWAVAKFLREKKE